MMEAVQVSEAAYRKATIRESEAILMRETLIMSEVHVQTATLPGNEAIWWTAAKG